MKNVNNELAGRRPNRVRLILASAVIGALSTTSAHAGAVGPLAPTESAGTEGVGKDCIPVLIDDFKSGAYRSPDLVRGSEDATMRGTMLGGRRAVRFESRRNRYRLPATLVVPGDGKAPLVVASGYQGVSKLQVHYGLRRAGKPAPLNADLSCHDRFRVHVAGSDLGLNLVVQVKSASSDVVYQCATNTEHVQPTGFVAEFEFKCFVTNDPAHPPVDWTDIDRVMLQVQPTIEVGDVPFGSTDYALSRFDLANGS